MMASSASIECATCDPCEIARHRTSHTLPRKRSLWRSEACERAKLPREHRTHARFTAANDPTAHMAGPLAGAPPAGGSEPRRFSVTPKKRIKHV